MHACTCCGCGAGGPRDWRCGHATGHLVDGNPAVTRVCFRCHFRCNCASSWDCTAARACSLSGQANQPFVARRATAGPRLGQASRLQVRMHHDMVPAPVPVAAAGAGLGNGASWPCVLWHMDPRGHVSLARLWAPGA